MSTSAIPTLPSVGSWAARVFGAVAVLLLIAVALLGHRRETSRLEVDFGAGRPTYS